MNKLMRTALAAAGGMNLFGAVMFLPFFHYVRDFYGLPRATHPLYLWIISIWIFSFGLCYLRLAVTGRRERLFLIIAAAGKLSFSILMIVYWAQGELPAQAAAGGLVDFFFGSIFAGYLWLTKDDEK